MQVLIIEDENPAANRLAKLLLHIGNDISIVQRLDSVESSVKFLQASTEEIDLIFMDIQLADGLSFDIFQQTTITTPVIFTTAFDQYTLKAFKVNSIDYLLKPIDEKELELAVEKYRKLYQQKDKTYPEKFMKMIREMNAAKYKERLLIKRGQQLSYLKTNSVAYCFADGKLCYAVDFTGAKNLLENNLSQLEEQLQPSQFYRINRHLLVNIEAVKKVHTWLGGRLKIEVLPLTTAETIVSRERVNGFKEWLGW
ncbi:MAG TPA: LytTR family DNA-binding domain-containing protein [Ferruginibacter sp.]|nr:LytTR family DNA-binding domain-containing protein [Ferruginibacter sp.]